MTPRERAIIAAANTYRAAHADGVASAHAGDTYTCHCDACKRAAAALRTLQDVARLTYEGPPDA